MTDYLLALGHFLLAFLLVAALSIELALTRPGITAAGVRRVAFIDLAYGICALLLLAVGFARATLAAKGWPYYSHNLYFWLKLGCFLLIALCSVPPTRAFLRWRRRLRADAGALPAEAEIRRARVFLMVEIHLLVPLLACATAMARGYGMFRG